MYIVFDSGSFESGSTSSQSFQDIQTQGVCHQWPRHSPAGSGPSLTKVAEADVTITETNIMKVNSHE